MINLPRTIRYHGILYRQAAEEPKHFFDYTKGRGVVFYVYALLTSKTGTDLPGVDIGWCKRRKSIPKEVAREMQSREAAQKAIDQDRLWFLKIEGKGWKWGTREGDKDVTTLQACLEFLARFRQQETVDGVQCLHCDLTNQVLG